MNSKKSKALRKIAKETGYPYAMLKKAYRVHAVVVKKKKV